METIMSAANVPGSARVACWRWRLADANFEKDCFGGTPKPARETRALPNLLNDARNR
jgi:hypothetical protein